MTTSLSNPSFGPDVCVKVNILNFMVTVEGLEDQLIGKLVDLKEPELESERECILLEDADNKKILQDIEDNILQLLKELKGNILDDESLIETLTQSKITSSIVENKMKIASKLAIYLTRKDNHISNWRSIHQAFTFVFQI